MWEAYAAAYLNRYGVDPKKNSRVNGQLKELVNRLGPEEAPQVAAFYLTHNNHWYVKQSHTVGCLLNDAEGLRTQWATGRKVTSTAALQKDRSSTNEENAKEAIRLSRVPAIHRLPAPRTDLEPRVLETRGLPEREKEGLQDERESEPSETHEDIEAKIVGPDMALSRLSPHDPVHETMSRIRAGHVKRLEAMTPPPELRTGT